MVNIMTLEELKALIEKASANLETQRKENEALQLKFKTLDTQHTDLQGKFDKLVAAGNSDDALKLAEEIKSLAV